MRTRAPTLEAASPEARQLVVSRELHRVSERWRVLPEDDGAFWRHDSGDQRERTNTKQPSLAVGVRGAHNEAKRKQIVAWT